MRPFVTAWSSFSRRRIEDRRLHVVERDAVRRGNLGDRGAGLQLVLEFRRRDADRRRGLLDDRAADLRARARARAAASRCRSPKPASVLDALARFGSLLLGDCVRSPAPHRRSSSCAFLIASSSHATRCQAGSATRSRNALRRSWRPRAAAAAAPPARSRGWGERHRHPPAMASGRDPRDHCVPFVFMILPPPSLHLHQRQASEPTHSTGATQGKRFVKPAGPSGFWTAFALAPLQSKAIPHGDPCRRIGFSARSRSCSTSSTPSCPKNASPPR